MFPLGCYNVKCKSVKRAFTRGLGKYIKRDFHSINTTINIVIYNSENKHFALLIHLPKPLTFIMKKTLYSIVTLLSIWLDVDAINFSPSFVLIVHQILCIAFPSMIHSHSRVDIQCLNSIWCSICIVLFQICINYICSPISLVLFLFA